MQDFTKTLKDAAYVTIGLGVIGFQKAQVRRMELTKQIDGQLKVLDTQLADARTTMTQAVKTLESRIEPIISEMEIRIEPVRTELEARIANLESLLPEQAKDVVVQARDLAKETQDQVWERFAPKAKSTKTAKSTKNSKAKSTKAA